MELSFWEQKLLSDLKKFEGLRLTPYNDSEGYATIGYGHLIAKRPVNDEDFELWKGFDKEDAEAYLLSDALKAADAVAKALPFYAKLDDARKSVLVGMAFQMGPSGLLGFKNTLKYVEQGNYTQAAANMRGSLWYKQTPNRAERLAKRMENGTWT